jgi:hypothetical protein
MFFSSFRFFCTVSLPLFADSLHLALTKHDKKIIIIKKLKSKILNSGVHYTAKLMPEALGESPINVSYVEIVV